MSHTVRRARLLLALVTVAALALSPGGEASAQSQGVLVVGDSLEVGTGPSLRRELGSTALTIDARKGRPSSEGVGVLSKRLRPGHRVVVFDLGVNDDPSQPAPLADNLATVRDTVGDRCLIVSTLSRPPLNGISIGALNRVISDFVAKTPGVKLFDWHAATQRDRGLLGPDKLHPGPAGYAARARLLAGVIGDCLDPAAAPATPDDGDAGEPPAEPPTSRSEPRRRPAPEDPEWLSWLRELPYRTVVTHVQNEIDRLDRAAREAVSAVSPPRPEPTLGAER